MVANQQERFPGLDLPYYGFCHDGYTYRFTLTSNGTCIVVRNNSTKEEIDLTGDL